MSGPRLETFGCRLNTFESEIMRGHAEKAGLDNAIIFNTCAVTAEATRQVRQAIRKARKENPDAEIIVTGCAAQTEAEIFAAMPEVTRVLGNEEKLKATSWLKGTNRAARRCVRHHAGEGNAPADDRPAVGAHPGLCCRCRTAATIAAPSASFPSAAAIRARCRWPTPWNR